MISHTHHKMSFGSQSTLLTQWSPADGSMDKEKAVPFARAVCSFWDEAEEKYSTEGCMYLTLSFNVYDIDNDGFDGWDNGSESDDLVYTGIGIGFNLK